MGGLVGLVGVGKLRHSVWLGRLGVSPEVELHEVVGFGKQEVVVEVSED